MKTAIRLLFIPLFALLVCEGVLRWHVATLISNTQTEGTSISRPDQYTAVSYWSAAFAAERTQFRAGIAGDLDGFWYRADFHGKWFSVQNNRRGTSDQPIKAAHTIWMIGGSPLYAFEIPDVDTIPSNLQRKVGAAYRVENLGMIAITAAQEVMLLKKVTIKPGDVVIMFDGSDLELPYAWDTSRTQTACSWLNANFSWLYTERIVCGNSDRYYNKINDDLVQHTYRLERQAVMDARNWSIQHGAAFFHFLEPTIYNPAPQGDELDEAPHPAVISAIFPYFQHLPYTTDLTHLFDDLRARNIRLFFGPYHVNEVGSQIIATAIYQTIRPQF